MCVIGMAWEGEKWQAGSAIKAVCIAFFGRLWVLDIE